MTTWGGDRKSWRVDFRPSSAVERDARKAERARPVEVIPRVIEVGHQRYVAYSADQLIAFETDNARPGFPI